MHTAMRPALSTRLSARRLAWTPPVRPLHTSRRLLSAPRRQAARPAPVLFSFSPLAPARCCLSTTSSSRSQPQSPSQVRPAQEQQQQHQAAADATALTEAQYHALADAYLDRLLVRLEALQDAREDVDVEYAQGVLTLSFEEEGGSGTVRTYVINKQPPNKQIWLSSPTSGPKRYDWIANRAGSGSVEEGDGEWIYLKDGSSLKALVRDEIGIDVDAPDADDAL